jgi:hypothetical protein
VAWLGSDAAGEVASYDVQYRYMPQGTWLDWQTGVTTNEALFDGRDGYTYAFRARATDTAGNVAPWPDATQAIVTVDLSPPQLTVITPTTGLLVPPGPLQVGGTVDPSAVVMVNGVLATIVSGTFTATLEVSEGVMPIRVLATDTAGNSTGRDVLVEGGRPLADISDADPDYPILSDAINRGLLSPDSTRNVNPDAQVTRAQFAKMLATAFEWQMRPAATPVFQDVGADHWARPFIETAAVRNVMAGYGDGNFYPDNPVTREQALKAIALAADWDLLTGPTSPFADVPRDYWAYPYIETAYRHGILALEQGDNVRPKAFLTRREVSALLYYTLGDLAAGGR